MSGGAVLLASFCILWGIALTLLVALFFIGPR